MGGNTGPKKWPARASTAGAPALLKGHSKKPELNYRERDHKCVNLVTDTSRDEHLDREAGTKWGHASIKTGVGRPALRRDRGAREQGTVSRPVKDKLR